MRRPVYSGGEPRQCSKCHALESVEHPFPPKWNQCKRCLQNYNTKYQRQQRDKSHPELLDRSAINIDEVEDLYIDPQGKRWIIAEAVARIWNYRADVEYGVPFTNYSRMSVRSRRADIRERYGEGRDNNRDQEEYTLPSIRIASRHLYGEEEAWTIVLSPRNNARPDMKNRDIPERGEKGRFISQWRNNDGKSSEKQTKEEPRNDVIYRRIRLNDVLLWINEVESKGLIKNGDFLTIAEAAQLLNVDPKLVHSWIVAGALPAIMLPIERKHAYRIHREYIDYILQKQGENNSD